eukprot:Em0009g632a
MCDNIEYRLILIAERATVYEKFPTPLINRLEKHFVLTKSVLTDWQHAVLEDFENWIEMFSFIMDCNRNYTFKKEDAFVGYQRDTPAAVVFQATHYIQQLQNVLQSESIKESLTLHLAGISINRFVNEAEGSELWRQAVLMQCKCSLLQTASPDALIRLKSSTEIPKKEVNYLNDVYFKHQHHSSLQDFLSHQFQDSTHLEGLLIQVTTHGHLMSSSEIEVVAKQLDMKHSRVFCFMLQDFDTELDFCNKIRILKKRDEISEIDNWVLSEALDLRRRQHSGTFCSSLTRKLDEVIIPIFAEVIAFCDQYCNLNLLHNQENDAITKFWISIFKHPDILVFNYDDIITNPRSSLHLMNENAADYFECQLPFFWLIKDAIDSTFSNISNYQIRNSKQLLKEASSLISQTCLGDVLGSVVEADLDRLYNCYLRDFVRSAHRCYHKDPNLSSDEIRFVSDALSQLAYSAQFCSVDGHQTLIDKICSLHVVYNMHKREVLWFGQLTMHCPDILVSLSPPNITNTMTLHLSAVEKALEILEPPILEDEAVLQLWLRRVKQCRNAIDSILLLPSTPKAFASRSELKTFRQQSHLFFIEVVSVLCFGFGAPENRLIEMLIDTVFLESSNAQIITKNLTPYIGAKPDTVPVIRSFLLKLLIDHRSDQAKLHLQSYFHKSQQTMSGVDQMLCLLCVQCFEVKFAFVQQENWIDPFVVYGPEYTAVRAAVNDALYGDDFDKLHEAVKAVAQFDKFIKDCQQLTNELNWMARTLLANTQGGPLEPLQAAPKQRPLERDICALMVHAAVVFITRKDTELLSPFVNMLNNPAALVNAYLPTMPDDQLPEVRTALSGTFYRLVQLIKPAMQESMVPEFIWRHLDKDISLLAKSLGKSTDESLLAIHMILRDIAQKDIPKDATDQTASALQSRSGREHWESRINQLYIQPFLQEMDQRLGSAMHAIHSDKNKEKDRLFYTVYERTKLSTDSIEPHLWVYRERICLEHLDHILLASNAHQKYPLLYTFLQEEQNLRATQYLPDIVYLQHYLYEKCNARLDRKGAKMAIRDFIMKESESTRVELQRAIVSLSKAWELVHERLTEHGQEVKYDFAALEKHIVDRFIYGKPHIMLMIPAVVFKEDRFTAATFGAIRRKVAQESLSQDRQEQIVAELSQTHKYTLKDALDAVEIIIRFLSSGGNSKSEKSLGEYAEKALKMDKHFCAVTHKYCKLKHVVSLWQTVSVQLARMLTLKGQEPFDQLDSEFLEKLTIDQESALTKMLRSCNLGQLLGILFEFIETFLRHSLSNLQWSLVETLEPFLQGHGISETRLLGDLDTVRATNSQAVAVWKCVVIYQDKQKKGTLF